MKGVEPRDQLETMLAAQMAAVHMATMTFAGRFGRAETIIQQESAERALGRLTRTFAQQMEALKRYRTGGQQKVTVEHVTVQAGGQTIVGVVEQGVGPRRIMRINPRHSSFAMHRSARCAATSKRSGKPCQAPAVSGARVCRMHGAGGGAPAGNRNALRHGGFTREVIDSRRQVMAIVRAMRQLHEKIE